MTLIVFEIFTQSLVLGDTFSKGLYFRSATVVKKAKAIAKQNNWKKLARINLPLAQYSQMYGCVDLHNLFHFLKLRQDPHAQYEIRVYADALLQLIQPIVPVAVKAYEDYILNSVTLTGKDIEALKDALRSVDESLFFGSAIGSAANTVFSNKREKDEFLAKIQRLKHI